MRRASQTRYFTDEPVPDALIFELLDTARFAPSGGNHQGWRVVVVTQPELRLALRDLYLSSWDAHRRHLETERRGESVHAVPLRVEQAADHFARNLHHVPVHLIVCVEVAALTITDATLPRPSIVGGASIYPFVQNLLLCAHNAGLGASITTLICPAEESVGRLLHIPDGFAVASLIALGWPVPERAITRLTRRGVEEFAFRDQWGAPFAGQTTPAAPASTRP
jgi:nitroreductase